MLVSTLFRFNYHAIFHQPNRAVSVVVVMAWVLAADGSRRLRQSVVSGRCGQSHSVVVTITLFLFLLHHLLICLQV